MSYLDEDFQKLLNYAQGLGIKVVVKDYVPYSGDAGYWFEDGSQIHILKGKKTSKRSLVLTLLHELAHHMGWIYSGKSWPIKYSKALDKEANKEELNAENRKAIYKLEKKDAKYQYKIAFETGLKLPRKLIDIEIAQDLYIYKHYYEKGKFPTSEEKKSKLREIKDRYKDE